MLVDILMFIVFWWLGWAMCHAWHKRGTAGNILLINQEDGDQILMLEIFEGRSSEIRPGNIVELAIKTEKLTRK